MGKNGMGLLFMTMVGLVAMVFALYYWLTELRVNWYALFICSIA